MAVATDTEATAGLALRSRVGRLALAATVLGSGIAFLDGTVVNVALPAIGEDLDTGIGRAAVDRSTPTCVTLTVAPAPRRLARRRLRAAPRVRDRPRRVHRARRCCCAVGADDRACSIAARALQGVGGALLVPGSLAIISATFHPDDRGRAVGAWSGLGRRGQRDRSVPRRLAGRRGVVAVGRSSSTCRSPRPSIWRSPCATCPRHATADARSARLDVRRRGARLASASPRSPYAAIEPRRPDAGVGRRALRRRRSRSSPSSSSSAAARTRCSRSRCSASPPVHRRQPRRRSPSTPGSAARRSSSCSSCRSSLGYSALEAGRRRCCRSRC